MSTFFIGDVHGCAAELHALLGALGCRRSRDRLLLTGDAFSRGPDPFGVWQIISRYHASMVLGNHDHRLRRRLRRWSQGERKVFRHAHDRRTFRQLRPAADALLEWLEQCPLCIQEDGFVLVHAGINPVAGVAGTTADEFMTIRLWPPAPGTTGPRWYEAYAPQDRLLVFGHDAPVGLVRRRDPDKGTYLVGLDSGCVYGHALSAYVLEEDRIVQVACLRPGGYWPP